MTPKQPSIITHWALVIGINYYSDPQENLKGCVNDANSMMKYLELSLGSKLDIVALTASEPLTNGEPPQEAKDLWPTYTNTKYQLERISTEAERGDRVIIYYAGHGAHIGGSTSALILLPDSGCGKKVLRLKVLYDKVEKMIKNDLSVTLILDCCFSGAIVRSDDRIDLRVRCLDYDRTVPFGTLQETMTSSSQDPDITRDANVEHNWHDYAKGLVVLCACAPEERTFETQLDGRYQGLFTHHLLHALNLLVKNGISVTHVAIQEQLSTSLTAQWSRQTPMRYGKSTVLFGESLLVPAGSTLHGYRDLNGGLHLRAGELHGIAKGDEFYASTTEVANTIQIHQPESKIANMRATTIRAVDSDLEEIEGYCQERSIGEWNVEPMTSLSPNVVSIGVPPGFVNEMQLAPHEALRYLRLVETQLASQNQIGESCAYHVLIDSQDRFKIVDAMLERVVPIPVIWRESADALTKVVRILRHIAEFKYFEGLENRIPSPHFMASFSIQCTQSAGSASRIEIAEGNKVEFLFENTSKEQLYVGVFNFKPSWEMAAMTHKGFKTLPAKYESENGTMRLTMKTKLPEFVLENKGKHCDDHVKFLITNTATHFHWSLPSILQTINGSLGSHRGEEENLSASLANLIGDFRGEQGTKWATKSFLIRTIAA
ncbi:caspase domain-containing protein [Boeremia exigua]|uniref:caspase domain-containing protein n=1 Tax=Boeremia exigua TaxID=749465 RepID=UPI001E8E8642|nr:caspase domain-containing protein [Boeremia exigua]KAH6616260.1 caspase domain-containing protein [Boeremia exigua]